MMRCRSTNRATQPPKLPDNPNISHHPVYWFPIDMVKSFGLWPKPDICLLEDSELKSHILVKSLHFLGDYYMGSPSQRFGISGF